MPSVHPVEASEMKSPQNESLDKKIEELNAENEQLIGLLAVLCACFSSGFAGNFENFVKYF